ncbi:hypothetical protein BU14_0126s0015 [Porphyra umbilicalis]|uniref:Magnesium transporter n=1 Tax=Porphyra umbilicalis TaxID=2786 RepID=A0A1X6PB55_PORUM|nr:hypothetical protein BU14_0126s0015 [Porphyra umbilicalis]|eukprot:OSX77976.1 hypothetical protein BU14_0126s0015 [Porphyra umbilicalis]
MAPERPGGGDGRRRRRGGRPPDAPPASAAAEAAAAAVGAGGGHCDRPRAARAGGRSGERRPRSGSGGDGGARSARTGRSRSRSRGGGGGGVPPQATTATAGGGVGSDGKGGPCGRWPRASPNASRRGWAAAAAAAAVTTTAATVTARAMAVATAAAIPAARRRMTTASTGSGMPPPTRPTTRASRPRRCVTLTRMGTRRARQTARTWIPTTGGRALTGSTTRRRGGGGVDDRAGAEGEQGGGTTATAATGGSRGGRGGGAMTATAVGGTATAATAATRARCKAPARRWTPPPPPRTATSTARGCTRPTRGRRRCRRCGAGASWRFGRWTRAAAAAPGGSPARRLWPRCTTRCGRPSATRVGGGGGPARRHPVRGGGGGGGRRPAGQWRGGGRERRGRRRHPRRPRVVVPRAAACRAPPPARAALSGGPPPGRPPHNHNLLAARDLRQVDPAFVPKPALWVRRNALVLSLAGVRALILHDRLFLFDTGAPAVRVAYRIVAARLRGLTPGATGAAAEEAGSPFEFLALEGLLIHAVVALGRQFAAVEPGLLACLEALATDLTVAQLEELRAAEQTLNTFHGRAKTAKAVLAVVLGNDEDMADMYLSDGAAHPARARNPLDHAEVEALLETYLQLVDDFAARASELLRAIDDTEHLLVIQLDIRQNHLLLVMLGLAMASTVVGAGATVTAVFGMNLALPPAMAELPSSAAYFWGVVAGLVGGMAAALAGLLAWGRSAGLAPSTPDVRTPWLLRQVTAASAGAGATLTEVAAKARRWPHARKEELARRAAAAKGGEDDGGGARGGGGRRAPAACCRGRAARGGGEARGARGAGGGGCHGGLTRNRAAARGRRAGLTT